jgi:hypothetical protein
MIDRHNRPRRVPIRPAHHHQGPSSPAQARYLPWLPLSSNRPRERTWRWRFAPQVRIFTGGMILLVAVLVWTWILKQKSAAPLDFGLRPRAGTVTSTR